jgi:hypothetical protein
MIMTHAQLNDVNTADSILLKRLKKKQAKVAEKALPLSLIAVSLAACGGTASNTETTTVTNSTDTSGSSGTASVETAPSTDVAATATNAPVKVSLEISNANDTTQLESGTFDTIDAVFHVSASFDATEVSGLETINLGIDSTGAEMASLGRADFDNLSAQTTTVNIFAAQQDVELDFASGANADIAINFQSESGAITVGSSNTGLQVLNAQSLTISQDSDFDVEIIGAVNLNG